MGMKYRPCIPRMGTHSVKAFRNICAGVSKTASNASMEMMVRSTKVAMIRICRRSMAMVADRVQAANAMAAA